MLDYCYVLIKDSEPCRQSFDRYEDAVKEYKKCSKENPMLFREYYLGGSVQIM